MFTLILMQHGFHPVDRNGCQALATDRVDGAVSVLSMSKLNSVGKSQSSDLASSVEFNGCNAEEALQLVTSRHCLHDSANDQGVPDVICITPLVLHASFSLEGTRQFDSIENFEENGIYACLKVERNWRCEDNFWTLHFKAHVDAA